MDIFKSIQLPSEYELVLLERTTSTMDEAQKIAEMRIKANRKKNDKTTVVIAKVQTSGRGRFGRTWISSKLGNLYCSVIIYPYMWNIKNVQDTHKMTFAFSIAVAEMIENLSKIYSDEVFHSNFVKCKWPNDIYINNQKIGGILTEISIDENNQEIRHIVVGVGLNIVHHPDDMPATSLHALKIYANITEVIEEFCKRLHHNMEIFMNEGFEKIMDLWMSRAYKIGETISFSYPYFSDISSTNSKLSLNNNQIHKIYGLFCGINKNGSMIVKIEEEEVIISMAEVL